MLRKGLFPDEKEVFMIKVSTTDLVEYSDGHSTWNEEEKRSGELVLTEDKIIFLLATGRLKSGRERHYTIGFDAIDGIREESKGISLGSLMGKINLIIAASNEEKSRQFVFSCSTDDCQQFIHKTKKLLKMGESSKDFDRRVIHLIKPKQEASLGEISKDPELLRTLSIHFDRDATSEEVLQILRNIVSELIVDGELDGVLENDTYISNAKLARKTVQYHVTIDFTSLFSQLKNKGIVLQKIECPSCKGELALPEDGSSIICKFCNSTVHATDIFEKFKALL